MTGRELLKKLREQLTENGDIGEELDVLGVLDALASAGLPGAAELYLELIQRSVEPTRVHPLHPPADSPTP